MNTPSQLNQALSQRFTPAQQREILHACDGDVAIAMAISIIVDDIRTGGQQDVTHPAILDTLSKAAKCMVNDYAGPMIELRDMHVMVVWDRPETGKFGMSIINLLPTPAVAEKVDAMLVASHLWGLGGLVMRMRLIQEAAKRVPGSEPEVVLQDTPEGAEKHHDHESPEHGQSEGQPPSAAVSSQTEGSVEAS